MKYYWEILRVGEIIDLHDEMLDYRGEEWTTVALYLIGDPYNPDKHRLIRRKRYA